MSYAEVQYFEGSFTSSIYSACSFKEAEQKHLLYASRSQVLCLGSEWGNYRLQQFSPVAVPEDATIISIDAFHRSPLPASASTPLSNSLVVLLAFHKPPTPPSAVFGSPSAEPSYDLSASAPLDPSKNRNLTLTSGGSLSVPTERGVNASQLNVYCAPDYREFGEYLQSDLTDVFASLRQRVDLDFLPSSIVHTYRPPLPNGGQKRLVLIAGSNNKVHFFANRGGRESGTHPSLSAKGNASGEQQETEVQTSSDSISLGKEPALGTAERPKHQEYEEPASHVGFGYEQQALRGSAGQGRYYKEADTAKLAFKQYATPIPELDALGSPPLSLCTSSAVNGGNLLGVGCRDGTLHLCETNFEIDLGFSETKSKLQKASLKGPLPTLEIVENGVGDSDVVVGGALGYAAVYNDVKNVGIDQQEPEILPKSRLYDSVLCSHVADLSWDGCKNIAIGTYGQELLVYEKVKEGQGLREKEQSPIEPESTAQLGSSSSGRYRVKWQRTFAHPLYSIDTGDFNQDGVDELVVNSLRGIHILQPDLEAAADKILLKVSRFNELKELSEALAETDADNSNLGFPSLGNEDET